MMRWYRHGDDRVNRGLPHYIVRDRKLGSRLEIQNAACSDTGIMVQLNLIKGVGFEEEIREDDSTPPGVKVLMQLVILWIKTKRIIWADSYFAFVAAVELLWENGLKFIGVVKTATIKFPMRHLSAQELENRGDSYELVRVK